METVEYSDMAVDKEEGSKASARFRGRGTYIYSKSHVKAHGRENKSHFYWMEGILQRLGFMLSLLIFFRNIFKAFSTLVFILYQQNIYLYLLKSQVAQLLRIY